MEYFSRDVFSPVFSLGTAYKRMGPYNFYNSNPVTTFTEASKSWQPSFLFLVATLMKNEKKMQHQMANYDQCSVLKFMAVFLFEISILKSN